MKIYKIILAIAAVATLAACSSTRKPMPSSPVADHHPVKYQAAQMRSSSQLSGLAVASKGIGQPVLVKAQAKKMRKGASAVRHAKIISTTIPRTSNFKHAITVYNYVPGILYKIYTAPLEVTDVEFQPGETITSIAGGDTLRWQVSKSYSGEGTKRRQHLVLKPNEPGLTNSLLVTTNRRTYHFELVSTKNDTFMPAVRWNYPEDTDMALPTGADHISSVLSQVNLQNLDYSYRAKVITGPTGSLSNPAWMPVRVFNDGHKTFIEFPKGVPERPALFVGNDFNADQIVNYRAVGNYYIIDHVVYHAKLQLGGLPRPFVVLITYTGRR